MAEAPQARRPRILVVGLDAADWKVIDQLLAAGRMPNLRGLISRGTRTRLESIPPFLSPVIWTSVFSGKMPAKHGVVDFFATGRSVKIKRAWDILLEHRWTVGLFEVMATWPPRVIDGFWIPDTFARDTQTFPRNLSFIKELAHSQKLGTVGDLRGYVNDVRRMIRFGARPSTLASLGAYFTVDRTVGHSPQEAYFRKRALKTKLFADFFTQLHREFDPGFSVFYTNLIDATSHFYWKYHEPDAFDEVDLADVRRFGGYVGDAYDLADRVVAQLRQLLGPEDYLIVLSDHGFRAMAEPGWEGYRLKTELLLKRVGLIGEVNPAYVGSSLLLVPRNDVPGERERAIGRLKEVRIRLDDGERPLLKATIDFEHYVHVNLHDDLAPSAARRGTVVFADGTEVPASSLIETTGIRVSGTHDPYGILIACGPGIREGVAIPDRRIVDVTPLTLYLAGLPIASDMDGRLPEELFRPDFLEAHPVRYIESYETSAEDVNAADAGQTSDELGDEATAEIVERLESLGYI